MLGIGVLILREVLEASLIISVVSTLASIALSPRKLL